MRVAFDATPFGISSGGLRRYAEELILALAAEFPDDHYALMSGRHFQGPQAAPLNVTEFPPPRNFLERRWWSIGVSRAIQATGSEVFHGTNFEVPYFRRVPSVMTLHDLSPWKNPEWHDHAGRVRRRAAWLLRLNRATFVITPTEAVRSEALGRFDLDAGSVVAVPHAAAAVFHRSSGQRRTRRYFVFASTLEPRKNVELLLEAWRMVKQNREADLILAGRNRSDAPAIQPEPGLELRGEVSDSDLAALYSGAAALVYPSHYEGFGLPVLEAMQCGCPVIVSADPALTEVAGGAALIVRSAKELCSAMRLLLDQPEVAADLRQRSLRRAASFSWAQTAQRTHAVYREAIARFR